LLAATDSVSLIPDDAMPAEVSCCWL
jgi:hypothetical protein